MKRLFLLILLILCGVVIAPQATRAQEETHPLLAMLALLPDHDETRAGFLSYVDYDLITRSRYSVVAPETYTEWEALSGEEGRLWMEAFERVSAGPSTIFEGLREFGSLPQIAGFGFFDIQRGLAYGNPPTHGILVQGDFDRDAVIAAHEARGYTTQVEGDNALLLHETGTQPDLDAVERGNIFDPSFGRRPPLVVADDLVAAIFNPQTAQAVLETQAGEAPSLLESPDIHALVEALTDEAFIPGDLVQMVRFNLADVVNVIDRSNATREELQAMLEDSNIDPQMAGMMMAMVGDQDVPEWDNYGTLPLYLGVAFADKQDGETQVNVIALLYATEEDARTGAEELSRRIAIYADTIYTRRTDPILDLLSEAEVAEPQVYFHEATGLYVGAASVRSPLPTPEGVPMSLTEDQPPAPGIVLRWWMRGIYQRSFYPLWLLIEEA
ncbi:MAG: hypothetical protein SF029_05330 [bacterium]|nr:hypothetical protein [bacterium]